MPMSALRSSSKNTGVFRMIAWKARPFWNCARMSPFARRKRP
jgi:hypothetical protein